jgi:MraZ protein
VDTFRGSYFATVDDKGRLKLPTRLKSQLEQSYGLQVFVTSLHSSEIRVYPLAVWEEKERKFLDLPAWDPLVQEFLERANYGQEDEVDSQGRVLVPAMLREFLGITGDVVVSGRGNFFAVVSRDRVKARVSADFTTEQWSTIAAKEKA